MNKYTKLLLASYSCLFKTTYTTINVEKNEVTNLTSHLDRHIHDQNVIYSTNPSSQRYVDVQTINHSNFSLETNPRTNDSMTTHGLSSSIQKTSSKSSSNDATSKFSFSPKPMLRYHDLNNEQRSIVNKFHSAEILKTYHDLNRLTTKTSTYLLLYRKNMYIYNKNRKENKDNEKTAKKYLKKFEKWLKKLKESYALHKEKLPLLQAACDRKKIDINKELLAMMYSCIEELVNNSEKSKSRISIAMYKTNKNTTKDMDTIIRKREKFLYKLLNKVQRRNLEIAWTHEKKTDQKLSEKQGEVYEKFCDLVERSYTSQQTLCRASLFKKENEIPKLRLLVINNHKKLISFLNENEKTIQSLLNDDIGPQYWNEVLLFSKKLMKLNLQFVQKTEMSLHFITQNIDVFSLLILRNNIIEQDAEHNKKPKKIVYAITTLRTSDIK